MSRKKLEVEQIKATSTTPPADRGFYKKSRTAHGLVGDLYRRDPVTGEESSFVTAQTDPLTGGIGFSVGADRVAVDATKPDLPVSDMSLVHWQSGPDYQYPPLGQPIIVTGKYTPGTGGGAFVHLGFDPDFVFVKADAISHPVWRGNINWYGRADYVAGELSQNRITSFRDGGFTVTNHAEVGAAGTTYYYLAIKDNGAGMLKQVNLFGNGVGRTVSGWLSSEPDLVIAKRDNANPMVMRFKGMTANAASSSLRADGSGTTSGIQSINTSGDMVIAADNTVNELNGPAGFGEACGFLAFHQNDFCQVLSYTGDGTASRNIALNFQPEAVIIANSAGTPKGPQMALAAIAGAKTIPFSGAVQALTAAGRIALTSTGVTINADTGVNAAAETYYLIAFKRNVVNEIKEQQPGFLTLIRRRGILLSGNESHIDCGTSDTLKLVGSCSFEWQGAVEWNSDMSKDIPLIMRANSDSGSPGAQGGVSWGFSAYQRVMNDPVGPQASVDYKGPTLRVVCSNWMDLYETGTSNPNDFGSWDIRYSPFNSGWVLPQGRRFHLLITHTSPGLWRMYINGRLYKERNINMVTALSAQNISSGAGHRTVIGARAINSGATIMNSARMLFERARVWNRALTGDEALARYQRGFVGLSVADVASGLVEEWDAENLANGVLAATVSPANNGTVVGGSIVTL